MSEFLNVYPVVMMTEPTPKGSPVLRRPHVLMTLEQGGIYRPLHLKTEDGQTLTATEVIHRTTRALGLRVARARIMPGGAIVVAAGTAFNTPPGYTMRWLTFEELPVFGRFALHFEHYTCCKEALQSVAGAVVADAAVAAA